MKLLVFFRPTQLPTHGQWWSMRRTHTPHSCDRRHRVKTNTWTRINSRAFNLAVVGAGRTRTVALVAETAWHASIATGKWLQFWAQHVALRAQEMRSLSLHASFILQLSTTLGDQFNGA
jgi:hypothetical protein